MADLPTGTVTFLYTDLEGSTALWEAHPQAMRAAVARHDALLRAAVAVHHGHVFRAAGDGLCAAFAVVPDAVAAALAAQRALHAEPWGEAGPLRVRMALHTGAVELVDGDYVGACLNRVGRLLAAGHGSQVVLSQATADLAQDALPPGAGLRPLGEQRLRDLTRPEPVFQLLHADLPAAFPPPRSLDAYKHNLPIQLTSFVGRERELAEVTALLTETRLLTLTGAGGCGKTRLALQAASEAIGDFDDGVWVVELAPLVDPDLAPYTVAGVVGVREAAGRPILSALIDYLKSRRLLLLLDNCEHLLDAAARLADGLLRGCPGVRVLATSREALGIAGETAWRLPSLALPGDDPTVEAIGRTEAVRLFVDRARAAEARFALTERNAAAVAQLCRRLDGIPLAIELAAARARALPIEQLAARLDDRFRLLTGGSRTALPRQQTLRAAIDWSHDLLAESERVLFRRLAVFAGGFTLAAAEAVGGFAPLEAWDVLDLLTRLVDKSLVLLDEGGDGDGRYRLLETIRQYARDRLLEAGEGAAVRDRHLGWGAAWAEQAEQGLAGYEAAHRAWLARVRAELDNLRAALEWSLERDPETGLRLAVSLRGYWRPHDHHEGSRWLGALLPRAPGRTTLQAHALYLAGHCHADLGDVAAARQLLEAGLALFDELADRSGVAGVLTALGQVALVEGDEDRARALHERSLALFRELDDRRGSRLVLLHLGKLAIWQGDYPRARALLEELVALTRALRGPGQVARELSLLGALARLEGDYPRARRLLEESLRLAEIDLVREFRWMQMALLGDLARAEGDYGRAGELYGEALRAAGEAEHRWVLAHLVNLVGVLAVHRGRHASGVRLLGASAGDGLMTAAKFFPEAPRERAAAAATARSALGEEGFAAAWAAGQAITPEQAVAEALAETGDG